LDINSGGVLGWAKGNSILDRGRVENSSYTGTVKATGETDKHISAGGFAGALEYTDAEGSRVNSGSKVLAVRTNTGDSGGIRAGGFVGILNRCALTQVVSMADLVDPEDGSKPGVVNGTESAYAGGLAGFMIGAGDTEDQRASITESYAGGKIYAKGHGTDRSAYAGGLAGYMEYRTSLTNSYSFAESVQAEGAGSCAGGIAGVVGQNTGTGSNVNGMGRVRYTYYAGGDVIASGGGQYIRAGGITGYITSPTSNEVKNNAVIPPNPTALTIQAKDGTTNDTGRITGGVNDTRVNTTGILDRNYALSGIVRKENDTVLPVATNDYPYTVTSWDGANFSPTGIGDFTNTGTLAWSSGVWKWNGSKNRPVLVNNEEP
jgi:hypothetical protein